MTQVQATPCELSISLPSRRDVERDLWNEQVQKAAGVRSEVVLNLLLDRPATELTPETILALFKRHLREPRLILSFLLSLTQESPAARDQIRGLVAGEARTIVENLRLAVGYSKTIESLEALALLKVLNKDEWLNLGTPTLRSTIEDIYVGALLSREVLRRGPHGERGASERVDFALVKLNSMVRLVTGQPLASFLLDEGSPNLARRIAEARCGPLDQSNGQGSSAEVVAWCFDHLGAQDVVLSRERGGFTDQAFQARLALDLQNRLRELYDRYDSLTPWSKEGRLGVLRDLRYLKLLLPLLGGNQGITETHAVFLARILRNEALSTETRGLFVFSGLASLVPTIRSVLPPPTTRETQQAHLDLLIFEHLTNPSGVTDEHRLSARSFVTQVHEIARSYCRDPQLTYPWGQLKLRLALNALLKIHIPLTANDCFQCIEGVLLSSDQKGFVGTGRSTDILALGITLTLMYPDQRATIWSAIDGSKLLQFFPPMWGLPFCENSDFSHLPLPHPQRNRDRDIARFKHSYFVKFQRE